MYRQFLSEAMALCPHLRVIGFTATPFRLDAGPICRADHFLNAVCYEIGVRELICDGFLSKLTSKAGSPGPTPRGSSCGRVSSSPAKSKR